MEISFPCAEGARPVTCGPEHTFGNNIRQKGTEKCKTANQLFVVFKTSRSSLDVPLPHRYEKEYILAREGFL